MVRVKRTFKHNSLKMKESIFHFEGKSCTCSGLECNLYLKKDYFYKFNRVYTNVVPSV